jgi:hypothetical protein
MPVLSAQTTGNLSTNASSFVAIPGLTLTLPEGDGINAMIVLNLPNPYAQGNNYPGGALGIGVNGTPLSIVASFTYGIQNPPSTNRMPTTLVATVPLIIGQQVITGLWCGIRGSTVIIDSPASLTAVVS